MAKQQPLTLGRGLRYCPNCRGEVTYIGRNKETNTVEKQCLSCDLAFFKKGRKRWVMKSMWDPFLY